MLWAPWPRRPDTPGLRPLTHPRWCLGPSFPFIFVCGQKSSQAKLPTSTFPDITIIAAPGTHFLCSHPPTRPIPFQAPLPAPRVSTVLPAEGVAPPTALGPATAAQHPLTAASPQDPPFRVLWHGRTPDDHADLTTPAPLLSSPR